VEAAALVALAAATVEAVDSVAVASMAAAAVDMVAVDIAKKQRLCQSALPI